MLTFCQKLHFVPFVRKKEINIIKISSMVKNKNKGDKGKMEPSGRALIPYDRCP